MKILSISVLVLGAVVSIFAETAEQAAVRAAHDSFLKAAKSGDRATLEKLFASDLQYSHSNAKLENKQEAIDALVKSTINFEVSSQTIRTYDKAATIRAKMTAHGASGDVPLSVLLVWIKNGNNWQLVERQTTRLPAQ